MFRDDVPKADADGNYGAASATPCARCGGARREGWELWGHPACRDCVNAWYDADHPRRATMSELAGMTPEQRAAVHQREQAALQAWTAAWAKRGAT